MLVIREQLILFCSFIKQRDLHLPSQALDPAGIWSPKAALLETAQNLEDAVTRHFHAPEITWDEAFLPDYWEVKDQIVVMKVQSLAFHVLSPFLADKK